MSGTWKLPAVDGDSGQYSCALIGRYRVTPEVAGNAVKNFRLIHVLMPFAFARQNAANARGKGDLVEFPPNAIERAQTNGIALLTGMDLLAAVAAHLEGREDKAFFDKLAVTAAQDAAQLAP